MSSEKYNQIIDEAYKNYWSNAKHNNSDCLVSQEEGSFLVEMRFYWKEEFIDKCKTDTEFSKKWGLKIEERELSLEERGQWCEDFLDWDLIVPNLDHDHIREDVEENAPTKLITITYKNEKTEVYE